MSAICGFYQKNGSPLLPSALDPIMDAMEHYGREGGSTLYKGSIVLGHQMTHVTPESSSENLPFIHEESSLAITSDARLDNRIELFALLNIPGEHQKNCPDSLLILKAFQRWDIDCPRFLLGDFAFAIWDRKQDRVFCARDVMGVKPLYYSSDREAFYFASDLFALLQHPLVPAELDLRYVRSYLEKSLFYHSKFTFYKDVFKLPPAHSLLVSHKGIEEKSYWMPGNTPQIRYKHEEEYIDHLRELLQQSVECRLRTSFPIGSHLSGGLDSSSISILAGRMLPAQLKPLHVFSWAPPPISEEYPLSDERAIIEEICKKEQMAMHYTLLQVDDFLIDQDQDITTHPTQTTLHERVVGRTASSLGIRVLLSGWGGDEIPAFNGRGYFADMFRKFHWKTLVRELYLRARLQEWSINESVRNSIILPLIPDFILALLRPKSWQLNPSMPLPDCLQPDFESALHETKPLKRKNVRERPGVRNNQIRLLNNGHLTERMESWAAIGATNGIEYRYPLMDRRLIDYCLSVPGWLFFRNGWKRYMFRRATEGLLPQSSQWGVRKIDPAVLQGMRKSYQLALGTLANHLKTRSEIIRSAGFVSPDCLIDFIYNETTVNPAAVQPNVNQTNALWLAYLSKSQKFLRENPE